MARPRKPKAETPAEQSNALLTALRFLSLITKDIGTTNETHVYLGSKWAIAYNSILTAAQPIPEDIYACPHNTTLINALSKCGQNLSITQLDINRISIKSDKFKAIVPCIDPSTYELSRPDPPQCAITDEFKKALEVVSVLTSEDGQAIHLTSILMHGQSVISSNGVMIFEYWHGLDLPSNIAVPKSLATVLVKSTRKLAQLGYSSTSVTFWFDDGSWIKSQLYAEQWPDRVHTILDQPCNAWPMVGGFYDAVTACQPFSPDGLLHFRAGVLASHASGDVGASYEVPGLPGGVVIAAKQLLLIKGLVTTVDFLAEGANGSKMTVFYGDKCRGVIAGRVS